MKLNYAFIGFFVALCQLSFSQQMPIDFSDNDDAFTTFGGSGFSTRVDPVKSDNTVAQFFNDGAVAWQGFYLDLAVPINLSTKQVITLSFYAFDPNAHNILIKLEKGENDVDDVEVLQSKSGSGWTYDIAFDFSNASLSGSSSTVNATGTYTRLVIYIDGGVTQSGTYLIDAINDGSVATDPNALDVVYTDLVWEDTFDSTGKMAIDDTKWFHQTQIPAGGNWYNGEQQHYTNRLENSFVENGNLNVVAIKESFLDQNVTKQYTSARLNSKFAFTYGRVDVKAKLPFGNGTWPAIWTLGKNITESGAYWQTQGFGTTGWPACGEIDIMEHGLGDVNHTSSALHTPSSFGNTVNVASQVISDVANNFHVYSMNWSPNQITFLVDGVGFYTYNPSVKDGNTWPFEADQYLILNIAMGGISGTISSSFTSSSMVIDYVKVYQNTNLSIEEAFASQFSVYPNPASARITINSKENIEKLEVFNAIGQLVLTKNKNTKQLNIEDLNSGIYVLKIHSGNRSTTKKLVKN